MKAAFPAKPHSGRTSDQSLARFSKAIAESLAQSAIAPTEFAWSRTCNFPLTLAALIDAQTAHCLYQRTRCDQWSCCASRQRNKYPMECKSHALVTLHVRKLGSKATQQIARSVRPNGHRTLRSPNQRPAGCSRFDNHVRRTQPVSQSSRSAPCCGAFPQPSQLAAL